MKGMNNDGGSERGSEQDGVKTEGDGEMGRTRQTESEVNEITDGKDNEGGDEGRTEKGKEEANEKNSEKPHDKNIKHGANSEDDEEEMGDYKRKPEGDAEELRQKSYKSNDDRKHKVTKDTKRTETNDAEEGTEADEKDNEKNTAKQKEEGEIRNKKTQQEDEERQKKMKLSTDEGGEGGTGGAIRAYLVVGTQEGWREGRVEEVQLRDTAVLFNYDYQVQSEEGVPRCTSGEPDDSLLIFLPRAEGVVQGAAGSVAAGLVESGAAILLPHHHDSHHRPLHALAGWTRQVREAVKRAGVTSLVALAQRLQESDTLRRSCRAKVDKAGRVFHVLNNTDEVDEGGLSLVRSGERYRVETEGRAPPVLLATPSSEHARTLLLSLSDYLTGELHPEHGCQACVEASDTEFLGEEEEETQEGKKEEEIIMVGVFIERPQPFLSVTLSSVFNSQLPPQSTHYYIYNQVQEYEAQVAQLASDLREAGVRHVTLGDLVPDDPTMTQRKNDLLEACRTVQGCSWVLHWSATAFLNPGIAPRLIRLATHLHPSLYHHHHHHHRRPVLAPALRVQQGDEASFWRGINNKNTSMPEPSWDHTSVISGNSSMRNHWRASCLRELYIIPRDVIIELTTPYTHPLYSNATLAFCAALRDAGVPMVVTTAVQNLGVLVNTTGYNLGAPDVTTYLKNADFWRVSYLTPQWRDIAAGNLSAVLRPCHEVYQFPAFNDQFCTDLLRLAYARNKWSPALKQDPRKRAPGRESVPTVDQWASDLGLGEMMDALYEDVLKKQLMISFPHSNPDVVVASQIARFRPGEMPGLPSHHDASSVTFHVHLSPSDLYQGGELEFPRQRCRVKAGAGDVVVFPGRLTHPKALRDVTEGELHKLIIHLDMYHIKLRHF
ncbi:multifunctional procollagen lysine hydroxylase and glycosyltransferase LH3-like isoform X2 [Scylla paramamosain]